MSPLAGKPRLLLDWWPRRGLQNDRTNNRVLRTRPAGRTGILARPRRSFVSASVAVPPLERLADPGGAARHRVRADHLGASAGTHSARWASARRGRRRPLSAGWGD